MGEKQSKQILIVEDEVELADSLKNLLEKYGYQVKTTYDTASSIGLAQKEEADLILLDLAVPGGGGFTILKEIRNSGPNKTTPVLIMSASTEQMVKDEAKNIGVNGYMCKPFEPEELIQNIKDLIGE